MTTREESVIPRWSFGDRLRKVRHVSKGGTQREMAARLGVRVEAYAQWEAGNAQPRNAVAIARRVQMLTRVPATWLLGLDDPISEDEVCAIRDSNPEPADYEPAGGYAPVLILPLRETAPDLRPLGGAA